MGAILLLGGGLLMLVGGIMIAVAAFKESVLWGLACLFIPFVALIFVITHFEESKSGLMFYVVGIGAAVLAAVVGH